MSPTQRSLAYLRAAGWYVCIVEKWVPQARRRIDAYGWGDLLAVHPAHPGAVLIQVTTGSHAANRAAKARGNPALVAWLTAGNHLKVYGWRKLKGRWQVSERLLTLADLNGTTCK